MSYTLATAETEVLPSPDGETSTSDGSWNRCGACNALVRSHMNDKGRCPARAEGHTLSSGFFLAQWLGHAPMATALRGGTSTPFPEIDPVVTKALFTMIGARTPNLGRLLVKHSTRAKLYPALNAVFLQELLSQLSNLRAEDYPDDLDATALDVARRQLIDEVDAAIFVTSLFDQLDQLYLIVFAEESAIVSEIQKFVMAERLAKDTEVDWLGFMFSMLSAVLGVIPALSEAGEVAEFARVAVEIAEAAITLGEELEPADWDARAPILTAEGLQFKELTRRFEAQRTNISTRRKLVLSDYGRLQSAARRVGVLDENKLRKAWITAYRIGLYQQLMPLRFCLVHACPALDEEVDPTASQNDRVYLTEAAAAGYEHVLKYEGGIARAIMKRGAFASGFDPPGGFPAAFLFSAVQHPGGEQSREKFPSKEFVDEIRTDPDGTSAPLNFDALLEGTGGWENLEVTHGTFHLNTGPQLPQPGILLFTLQRNIAEIV